MLRINLHKDSDGERECVWVDPLMVAAIKPASCPLVNEKLGDAFWGQMGAEVFLVGGAKPLWVPLSANSLAQDVARAKGVAECR